MRVALRSSEAETMLLTYKHKNVGEKCNCMEIQSELSCACPKSGEKPWTTSGKEPIIKPMKPPAADVLFYVGIFSILFQRRLLGSPCLACLFLTGCQDGLCPSLLQPLLLPVWTGLLGYPVPPSCLFVVSGMPPIWFYQILPIWVQLCFVLFNLFMHF